MQGFRSAAVEENRVNAFQNSAEPLTSKIPSLWEALNQDVHLDLPPNPIYTPNFRVIPLSFRTELFLGLSNQSLPEFWSKNVIEYFKFAEVFFQCNNIHDKRQKYCYLITTISFQRLLIDRISVVLRNNNSSNPYSKSKKALIERLKVPIDNSIAQILQNTERGSLPVQEFFKLVTVHFSTI